MEKIIKILKIVSIVSLVFEVKRKCRRRWCNREPNINREEDGFFNKCYQQTKEKDEEHFFKLTRMSVHSFNFLFELLKDRLQEHYHRKLDPESRLAITLIYLGHGCSPQILAWSFKIGISTIREIVYETCEIMYQELHDIYLPVLNHAEYRKIASCFFEKTTVPNCIGAIDGKHIRMVCPKNSGYFNYKKYVSLILLAICDANYTFTFYKIGAPGHKSDSCVFMETTFGKKVVSETLNLPESLPLPGTNIKFPYYFVGDAAFPLKQNLMRPYPGSNLSEDKSKYNSRISKARSYIENSFGILANKWRILHTSIYCNPSNMDKIVSATILLHNFLMLQKDELYFTEDMVDREVNGEFLPGTWREDTNQLTDSASALYNRSSDYGFYLRNKLKDYLCTNS